MTSSQVLLFLLLLGVICQACQGAHVALTRNTHKRQALLKQARDFGLPDDQRLPVRFQVLAGRNTTSRAVASNVALLGGLSYGEIYAELTLGTPAKTFTAQIDTGSSDFALPVGPCKTCSNLKDAYHPKKSSTSVAIRCPTTQQSQFKCLQCDSKNKCGYTIDYLDGSGFQANLHTDVMTMGGLTVSGQSVGCIRKVSSSNFEPNGVDGILGLAYSSNSVTNSPTFMDSLVSGGQAEDIFSICLDDNGGVLELGGIVQSFDNAPQYLDLVTPLEFYTVVMDDFQVDGQSLNLPSSTYNTDGTIFDSGTTSLAVPNSVYQAIYDSLFASCSTTSLVGICDVSAGHSLFDGYCFQMTADQIAMFPDLQVVLSGGVTLTIPPQYWIVDGYCSKPGYSLLVQPIKEEAVILGDVVHRLYTVIYDRVNSQIGVAQTTSCPSN